MKRRANILSLSLDALKIKHSRDYSDDLYSEHPERGNLLGVVLMLHEYGVETKGVSLDSVDQFVQLQPPFIVHRHNKFVVIKEKKGNFVVLHEEGKIRQQIMSDNQFFYECSKFALIIRMGPTSGEPDYKKRHRKEFIKKGLRIVVIAACLLLLSVNYYNNRSFIVCPSILLFLLFNIVGLWVCWQLVQQQCGIRDTIGGNICQELSKNGCVEVLQSEAASFFGIFSWSEMGLGYFCANLFLISVNESIAFCATHFIFFLIPLTFISIWYQKKRLKSWCALCLFVMGIIWLMAISTLLFPYDGWLKHCSLFNMITSGCCYVVYIGLSHVIVYKYLLSEKLLECKRSLSRIKTNPDVFNSLLVQEPHFDVSENDSHIILGNPNAHDSLTILSNPHCAPCATVHKQVRALLQRTNDIKVRYIFTSFSRQLLQTNRLLISTFFNSREEADNIFNSWFEYGLYDPKLFWRNHSVHCNDIHRINSEIKNHITWARNNKLSKTPLVLVNGYLLPKTYSITDISLLLTYGDHRKISKEYGENTDLIPVV